MEFAIEKLESESGIYQRSFQKFVSAKILALSTPT